MDGRVKSIKYKNKSIKKESKKLLDLFCKIFGEDYLDAVEVECRPDDIYLRIIDSDLLLSHISSELSCPSKFLLIEEVVFSNGYEVYKHELGEVETIQDFNRLTRERI